MASLGIHMRRHINLLCSRSVHRSLFGIQRRKFHKSPSPRWVSPETLSINELRRECERRDLPVSGTRSALIQRIKSKLSEIGGYDNGLTFDENLIALKREIESQMNKIPDNAFISTQLAVERSVFEQLRTMYENDDRVKFDKDVLVVTLEGKYVETCALRAQISAQASEIASNETSYSLPHNVVVSLKEKFLRDIRRDHNVKFQVSRCRDNAANAIVLTVQGETQDRMAACDVLETIVNKIRYSQFEVPPLESYERQSSKKKRRNRSPSAMHRALVISPDSWEHDSEQNGFDFTFFDGIVMHVDLRTKEMLESYRSRLNLIAEETETKIHLGGKDMWWLSETQLAIESAKEESVRAARIQCDQLINQLKSLTMTLALPPHLSEHFLSATAREDIQSLADYLQRYYGVDSMIMEHGERIYIHLVGTSTQANQAACAVDTRLFRLNRLSKGSMESQLSVRRERIRNLNFSELGIGGMEESLGIMLRRTFESRLISPRLRKELGLTHIRGVLLHGAPGTGKTLIARKISDILGCKKPRIVNGPEVESKWVGEAEKNIRKLFEPDEEELLDANGSAPSSDSKDELNVVIFDEIDSIAKKRGGAHGKSRDGALNQLLCCLDGVQEREDILVFGLTNRKDCLDPALLRPGRLEVQLEIPLPDMQGREDILKIHTRSMREYGRLCEMVNLRLLASYAEDFSGADLAGMVRSAISFALEECEGDDEDGVQVRQDHLEKGLHEIRVAKDRMPDADDDVFSGQGLMQA